MAALQHGGTYRRALGVSIERIWENALDWEHLPYLHASTFTSIELLERTTAPELWRARVGIRGVIASQVVIELRTDRPRLAYVTTTIEGLGRGTEIRTRLQPRGEHQTDIVVEFHVASGSRLVARVAAAGYQRLYHRLWSEDEAMMRHRQRVLDVAAARRAERDRLAARRAPEPVALGPLPQVRERLPLKVATPRGELRVIALGSSLLAHPTTCPHLGGPLGDVPVIHGSITCPWHGYRFDVRTGRAAGPHRCKLPVPPQVEVDPSTQLVRLVWAAPDDVELEPVA
ncbi:MAG: Rieske (2Fe-2S) protein [Myxococcota bacterium]|nr:Rieske (2Fe-2S) protein [Myxococcota bacterium]